MTVILTPTQIPPQALPEDPKLTGMTITASGTHLLGQALAEALLLASVVMALGGPVLRARRKPAATAQKPAQLSYKSRGKNQPTAGGTRKIVLLAWGRTCLLVVMGGLLALLGPLLPLASLWLFWLNGGSGMLETGGMNALLLLVLAGGAVGGAASALWEGLLLWRYQSQPGS